MVVIESAESRHQYGDTVMKEYNQCVDAGNIEGIFDLENSLAGSFMGHELSIITKGLCDIGRKFPEKIPILMEYLTPAASYTGDKPDTQVILTAINALAELGGEKEKPILAEIISGTGRSSECNYNSYRQKAVLEGLIAKCSKTKQNPLAELTSLVNASYPPIHALKSNAPITVIDDKGHIKLYIRTDSLGYILSTSAGRVKKELEKTYKLICSV